MTTDAEALTSPHLPARHGFFTRRGGVSAGPYASLNCGLSGGDRPDSVAENRARAARRVGAEPAALVGLTQVHGAAVVRVAEPWPPGAGPRADALGPDRPGVALGVVTADCAPVWLADPAAGVIGAVHAGWRGAAAGVLEAAVAEMAALGAAPGRIRAAVGPCIGRASYEVGPDVRDAVTGHDPADARFFAPGRDAHHWWFDLAGYCARRLRGLAEVEVLDADTAADEARFFSHRRRTLSGGGPIGHQLSAIVL